MNEYLLPIEILIDQFRKLPGVGRKTAARYAMAVLDMTDESARAFSESIAAAKKDIHRCPVCNNFTDGELCPVCLDENRLPVICVVEDVRALLNIEKVRDYRGRYHVLGGVLSPIKGIGPEKLGIDRLTKRIASEGITEVIVATNPTVEDFLNYLENELNKCDPHIYVEVGDKNVNFDYLSDRIVTEYNEKIYKGIMVIYRNKMYDYSL